MSQAIGSPMCPTRTGSHQREIPLPSADPISSAHACDVRVFGGYQYRPSCVVSVAVALFQQRYVPFRRYAIEPTLCFNLLECFSTQIALPLLARSHFTPNCGNGYEETSCSTSMSHYLRSIMEMTPSLADLSSPWR